MRLFYGTGLLGYLGLVQCVTVNFDYESIQLTEETVAALPALSFGNTSDEPLTPRRPRCKVHPGDKTWPSTAEWKGFNASLGGVLLKPTPPGAACYPDHDDYDPERCDFLMGDARRSRFWIDNPLGAVVQWAQGNTCPVEVDPAGECTQGGYPAYVVNATSVRHIQMAVNFSRNKNIRLTVTNTGHEFSGKSTGYGSLSIWIHHLKGIELLDDYTIGEYTGGAAKISAGSEGWEALRVQNGSSPGITIIAPGQGSVGLAGGWLQGGGHSTIAGYYGLAADQVLSLNVVTADGRFVTADVHENRDLFFALRGGGGGTYGIVTSAIVRTYPAHTYVSGLSYSFTTGPSEVNARVYDLFPVAPSFKIESRETFWEAYAEYFAFTKESTAVKGFAFGDVTPVGNDSYTFASMFAFPQASPSEAEALLEPLFERFAALGVNITAPDAVSVPYARVVDPPGPVPGQDLFASRLLPRSLWDDEPRLGDTTRAIRQAVEEGGLQVRSRGYSPTLAIAGYPTTDVSSGINPALRETAMHLVIAVTGEGVVTAHSSPEEWLASHATLEKYTGNLRDLTPDGGAYVNEADVSEPDWQQSFWGSRYPELLKVKRERDPWDLFWGRRMVGSEGWEVETPDEVPSQNGPLCRTGYSY
ncbi:uncharacterized protein DNG_03418 [Cephalotrichum gorgonifer]|uniref:FAD-binding PCMH-type domain-containing protein n=1 Tax=Cephalotrichum gorgonifer TaxID=2041049 RepID=A0AAE8MX01_9PEZI|nr:uncharacterized protein DNG_03418 [Cephalotrichum gorgonifer]